MNPSKVSSFLSRWGLAQREEGTEKLALYYKLLLDWNNRANLTAITTPEDFLIKHVADSLWLIKLASLSGSLADVGTGAGFPGLLLKISNPQLSLTLIDSSAKRVNFLRYCCQELAIEAEIIEERVENLGRFALRERFDWVVARALAQLPVLAEYCLPLVNLGGVFVAYKGPQYSRELEDAAKAVNLLGGRYERFEKFVLPDGGQRTLIFIRKKSATPAKYPRRAGLPTKRPLK